MDEAPTIEGACTVNVGQNVKRLRKQQRYTQTEIARWCGVTPAAISGLEHGDFIPSTPLLAKLARALGVSMDELVGEPVAPGKAEASRPSYEPETPRRSPDLERLSSNLQDRIRDFLRRWMEVADYLQHLEGEPTGGYVWLLDLHRNVTREAAFLIRDVVELGDYVGLASNIPQVIHAAAERVRLGVDLAVARAELEEVAQWNLLMREIVYDLAKTKPEEEEEFARVVDLAAERERRRVSDSDDTTAARGAG